MEDELVIDCTADLIQRQQQLEAEVLATKLATEEARLLRQCQIEAAQEVLDRNPDLVVLLQGLQLSLTP